MLQAADPALQAELCIVWKKYQVFTKAAELFLHAVHKSLLSS